MRRILITGGAGFIGYHLASALTEEPETELLLIDDFSRGRRDDELSALLKRPGVAFQDGDLTDPDTLQRAGDGFDEVYHLAAVVGVRNVMQRPDRVIRVNALATLNTLEWFVRGGGRKLVFSSTSESYAWTQKFYDLPVPTPEDVPLALTDLCEPRSSYAGSKIFGELSASQYGRIFDRPITILRYHNVYGPRMGYEHVIPELALRALRGEDPLRVYSCDHTRAFCYVSDAIHATIAAMRSPAADGRTLNVGNSEEIAIGELARSILHQLEIKVEVEPRTGTHDPIRRRCPDCSLARELLGYEPEVSLHQGLRPTLEWYAARAEESR